MKVLQPLPEKEDSLQMMGQGVLGRGRHERFEAEEEEAEEEEEEMVKIVNSHHQLPSHHQPRRGRGRGLEEENRRRGVKALRISPVRNEGAKKERHLSPIDLVNNNHNNNNGIQTGGGMGKLGSEGINGRNYIQQESNNNNRK